MFIAIELPDSVRNDLYELRQTLKTADYTFIKWVNSQGIHLTLKFIGNVKMNMLQPINQAIVEGCSGCKKFSLEIAELGAFPNLKKPRVIWIGVEGNLAELKKLQDLIDAKLEILGFLREKRPFSPHITLARINERADSVKLRDFADIIQKCNYRKRFQIFVEQVSIIRSQLLPTGAVYSKLKEIQLMN